MQSHGGALPRRTSQDAVERGLAVANSKLPLAYKATQAAAPLRAVLDFIESHGGALPKEWCANAKEERCARNYRIWLQRFPEAKRTQTDKNAIRQIEGSGKRRSQQGKWGSIIMREAALKVLYSSWCRTRRAVQRASPSLQKLAVGGGRLGGTSPFPWLVNLGNTCYHNAVLH